jgi:hypothetical protein
MVRDRAKRGAHLFVLAQSGSKMYEADFAFDVTENWRSDLSATLTSHPVERSPGQSLSVASDHFLLNNRKLSLSLMHSDTAPDGSGHNPARTLDALYFLEECMKKSKLLDVKISESRYSYTSMMITSVVHERARGALLNEKFRIELQQVRYFESALVLLPEIIRPSRRDEASDQDEEGTDSSAEPGSDENVEDSAVESQEFSSTLSTRDESLASEFLESNPEFLPVVIR